MVHNEVWQARIKIVGPQEAILSSLLLNIFINDVCLVNLDSEMYKILQTDDNTLYLRGHDLQEIVSNLENNLCKLLEWFRNNGMVVNPKEFQLMFLGMTTNRQLRFNFEGKRVNATGRVKLLGVETESK